MKSGIKHGKRGRPKKVQPKVDVVTTKPLVLKKDSVVIDMKQSVLATSIPIKRGRGRPPKSGVIKGVENITIKSQLKTDSITVKPFEYIIKKDGATIDMNQPVSIVSPFKRGRGRPPKSGAIKHEMNINIKSQLKEVAVSTEDYIQPQILRKKRVFRFDKRLFHQFAQKYNGDIVIMSYVYDKLMQMFVNNKIKIPTIDESYYHEWCSGTPSIEPATEREISSANAFMRGIPVQYKYSLLIDEDMFSKFERSCKRYPQYISNELLKKLIDDNINIPTSKYKEWCTV